MKENTRLSDYATTRPFQILLSWIKTFDRVEDAAIKLDISRQYLYKIFETYDRIPVRTAKKFLKLNKKLKITLNDLT